jgi:hypothetical protein
MNPAAKSNIVGAIAGTVTALLLYGVYTLIPTQPSLPLMIVIDGAPHLRGAHQQTPNGVKWTPPLGGPQTVAGADVPREDSKKDGELQSRARGGECKSVDPERGNPSSSALVASPKGLTGTKVGTRRSPQREPVTADTKGQPRADEASRSLYGERQVMPNEGRAKCTRDRSERVVQRDSTSRAWLACIEAIFENVERARETEARTAGVLALEISSCTPHAPRSASKEGVPDGRSNDQALHGDLDAGSRAGGVDGGAGSNDGRGREESGRHAAEAASVPRGAGEERLVTLWTNATDQPWKNSIAPASTPDASAPKRLVVTAGFAGRAATGSTTSTGLGGDCRPSADTTFTPSAAAWIAKANAWADAIDAKYDRAISIYYDRLRCNGSIPYGWYVSTHNTLTGAAFSDETPVEWMCARHMDSPLAAMMVHALPVMRPTFGGPYTSVLISYNDHDRRIAIGEGTEYAGCGRVATGADPTSGGVGYPCVFRAAFPCVWPLWRLYDDGKGGAVAVVSGWDVKVPGRIEVGPKEARP